MSAEKQAMAQQQPPYAPTVQIVEAPNGFRESDPRWVCGCCGKHVKEASRIIFYIHIVLLAAGCVVMFGLAVGYGEQMAEIYHMDTTTFAISGTIGAIFGVVLEIVMLILLHKGLESDKKEYILIFTCYEAFYCFCCAIMLNPWAILAGWFVFILYRTYQYMDNKATAGMYQQGTSGANQFVAVPVDEHDAPPPPYKE